VHSEARKRIGASSRAVSRPPSAVLLVFVAVSVAVSSLERTRRAVRVRKNEPASGGPALGGLHALFRREAPLRFRSASNAYRLGPSDFAFARAPEFERALTIYGIPPPRACNER